MKKLLLQLLLLLGFSAVLSACETEEEPDGSVPYIQVHAPRNNSAILSTDPVHFSVTATDKDKITGFFVYVYNADDEELYKLEKYPNINVVSHDADILSKGLPTGNYSLVVRAVDGRSNEKLAKVNFKVSE